MTSIPQRWPTVLTALITFLLLTPAYAQEGADAPTEETKVGTDESSAADNSNQEESPATEDSSDSADEEEDGEDEAAEENEEESESSHGSYEWQMSFGGGLRSGVWLNELSRWNVHLLDPNSAEAIDMSFLWASDLFLEASLLEGTRLSLFFGMQNGSADSPDVSASYMGIEPAFAFRRGIWELSVGFGIGMGGVDLKLDSGQTMEASLVLLRPAFEVRGYLNEWVGLFGRVGFNHWLIKEPKFNQLTFSRNGESIAEDNLDEGGPFIQTGFVFGHYPEHVKFVADTDEDGYRDDVDKCPEEAEDFDKFEDEDGCPEADNDQDKILDAVDKCPLKAEDYDGWQDEDGCPETDDDSDGDGILNPVDKCPNDAEDKDGFEDEDGCPDTDNDQDQILDVDDKCPNEKGVPEKSGCPFKRVEVTMKKIVINDKIFFEYNKAVIKEESFGLLEELAQVLNGNPQILKIEIQGHTDSKGGKRYNQKLSSNRAKSVLKFLVDKGVSSDRLSSKGFGFSTPLVPIAKGEKESEEDAAKNRRVELIILEQAEVKKVVREDQIPNDAVEKKD